MSTAFTPNAAGTLGGPDWLTERRVAAADRFVATPRPDVGCDGFELDRYAPSDQFGDAPMPRLDVEPAALIRCVNGRVMLVDVDADLVGQGVHIGPLATDPNGAARLGSVAEGVGDWFTVLNDAFMDWPLLVDVPEGVVIDRPIVVTHHAAGAGGAAFPRLVVRIGENAHADVMDLHTSEPDDDILMCPVVELDVEASGRLGYLKVQEQGRETWQFGSVLSRVGRDATITAATAAFGAKYARTRADLRLVGPRARGDLMVVSFGADDQILDFHTHQDHLAPDTTSSLISKGVVAGRSRRSAAGVIRVRPEARGADVSQTDRTLELGDEARSESAPSLEIGNDGVRCNQTSAAHPVDEDQRFYLESRGVPPEEAERLIIAGFLGEVLGRMPVPSAVPALVSAIGAKSVQQHRRAAERVA